MSTPPDRRIHSAPINKNKEYPIGKYQLKTMERKIEIKENANKY
jgi:hypothetical protein